MKPNRSCPGVPNRYKRRPPSKVMRPKSMATVVVVLSGSQLASSTFTLTEVIAASVLSGTISETAPTKVVFPTPKPPEMTILTDFGCPLTPVSSKGADAIDQPPDQLLVLGCRRGRLQHAVGDQIADQHPRDTYRNLQFSRHFSDRKGVATTQQDAALLEQTGIDSGTALTGCRDQRLKRQFLAV